MTDSPNGTPSRSIGDYIRAAAAFGILATIFMAGFTISSNQWSSVNAKLEADLRDTRQKLQQTEAELKQVTSEYASYRQEYPAQEGELAVPSKLPQPGAPPSGEAPAWELVGVEQENTVSVFDGDLFISLVGTSFEGDPLGHKVFATVGSPGYPSLRIEREDVGYVVTYQGEHAFEIRIMKADTFSAEFLVTRTQ